MAVDGDAAVFLGALALQTGTGAGECAPAAGIDDPARIDCECLAGSLATKGHLFGVRLLQFKNACFLEYFAAVIAGMV